jgi:hemoglobin
MPSEKEMLRDIQNRDDLLLVMTRFYELMLADEELRPIFTDVARIHLETHLPVLADFWEGILFGTGNYQNNPMAIHLDLHRKHPLTARHFELWLLYFNAAVDAGFTGDTAHLMKTRALSIATVMQIKVMADK